MMKGFGFDHVIIVSKKGNFMHTSRLPYKLLIGASIVLGCIVIATATLGIFNTRDILFEARLSKSEVENHVLVRRLDSLKSLLLSIHSSFDNYISLDNRERTFLEMAYIHPDVWSMGIGGTKLDLSPDVSKGTAQLLEDIHESIDILAGKCYLRQQSLSDIDTKIDQNVRLWAHIPSINPVPGYTVGSGFGYRVDPINKRSIRMHWGVDIGAPRGAPIHAAADGTVSYTGWNSGYGLCLDIDHGYGFKTRYAHCSSIIVKPGDKVTRGQVVAKIGDTGRTTCPHLHYEVHVSGVKVNPAPYIDNSNIVVD
jgi:hypothetical protein